ncbi:MAG: hypothetical protein IKV62_08220 [Bacteroidales bacterium]|nr:hypothetical protein [Bacteroidales bacterium]
MRFSKIPILSACLVIVFSACHPKARHESEWETALRELDRTLAREQSINQMLEKDLAELKKLSFDEPDLRVRYHFYDRIFDGYLKYDVDSALLYAHVKDRIASRAGDPELRFDAALDLAQRYLISGTYHVALSVLYGIDTTDTRIPENIASYYQTLNSTYHGLALTAKDPFLVDEYRESEAVFRKLSQANLTDDMIGYYTVNADIDIKNREPQKARKMLEDRLRTADGLTIPDKSILHYWIAKTYEEEGDQDREVMHYAISANYDRLAPVKASRSLIHLSHLLFERGDIKRAYGYIIRAYEDATRSDARIGLEEINRSLPTIVNAYEKMEQRRERQLRGFLTMTILFMVALGAALLLLIRDRKRIGRMQKEIQRNNEEIKAINAQLEDHVDQLKESNQIKDTYLGRYLSMFSEHIDSLERYRSKLRVTAKSKDFEDILQALKSDAFIDKERKVLYDEFDATFLGVFPDFVGRLNGMLREDARIGEELPKGKLSNELRIFALIRLGVTESAKIAQFLKKSPSTIYNYRVKLRNAALCDRDDFEKKLMEIGNPGV